MASMPEAVHAKAVLAAARGAVTADNGVVLREAACVASVDARAAPDPTPLWPLGWLSSLSILSPRALAR